MRIPPTLEFADRRVLLKYHMLLSGSGLAPANSIPALLELLEGGARVIEFDLRATRDGKYVLLHDETLQRETSGHGLARGKTAAEISEMRLRDSDEPVVTLDQVVEILLEVDRPLKVQLDFKETLPVSTQEVEHISAILQPLLDHPRIELVLGCLADWNLRAMQRGIPGLTLGFDFLEYLDAPVDEPLRLPTRINAYGYLDDHPLGWRRLQPAADYLLDRVESLITLVPTAKEFYLRAEFVTMALADGFDPVDFIHRQRPGSLVDIWTVDRSPDGANDEELRRLLATGADQLTTNTALQWVEAVESEPASG